VRAVDQLLHVLRRGPLSPRDLQHTLEISQPTLSRLVRQAGPRVIRLGRSVATRYALPRPIPGLQQGPIPVYRIDVHGQASDHAILHALSGGDTWLERTSGDNQLFTGLPPFVHDMRPQGYIGRAFPALYPELNLPLRITDWTDDHQLVALALRGEDCVGNLILGQESLDRFLSRNVEPRTRADYPSLASGVLAGQPGSSAGGEHPKFAVTTAEQHLLVKFASGDGPAADRWRDLLIAEHLALETLRAAGHHVPRSHWFDLDGIRFLEVERFDRVGTRGRLGLISLFALNCQFLGGEFDTWSQATQRILAEPNLSLSQTHADQVIWLDTFGALIANTDRHFGNLSFFAEEASARTLIPTPAYDMLPMLLAPVGQTIVERSFTPQPPIALNRNLWPDAATQALHYWARLCDEPSLTHEFRRHTHDLHATLAHHILRHS
jgi:hypothetical protein